MVDPVAGRIWAYRGLFALLILGLCLGRMLPLGLGAGRLPGPDVMLALLFAWTLRRPAYVPAGLVVALFLIVDLLLQQPPGMGTLVALVGAEILRARIALVREQPFPLEWALVAAALLVCAALTKLLLAGLVVEGPPLGLLLIRALMTAAAYPVVVLVSAWVFGVKKPQPGEVDAMGHRV